MSGRVAREGGATGGPNDEDAGGVFWYAGNVGLGTPPDVGTGSG